MERYFFSNLLLHLFLKFILNQKMENPSFRNVKHFNVLFSGKVRRYQRTRRSLQIEGLRPVKSFRVLAFYLNFILPKAIVPPPPMYIPRSNQVLYLPIGLWSSDSSNLVVRFARFVRNWTDWSRS